MLDSPLFFFRLKGQHSVYVVSIVLKENEVRKKRSDFYFYFYFFQAQLMNNLSRVLCGVCGGGEVFLCVGGPEGVGVGVQC